jgi:hypothetical protein
VVVASVSDTPTEWDKAVAQTNQASKNEMLNVVQHLMAVWRKQSQPGLSDPGAAITGRTT